MLTNGQSADAMRAADPATESVTGQWLSVQAAAQRAGVSPDTIRSRIKTGKLQARKKQLPQGFAYEVFVLAHEAVEIIAPEPPMSNGPARWEAPPVDLGPLADVVCDLVARIGVLERENGALQAELAQRDRLLAAAPEPPRRPWWRFWANGAP